MMQWYDPLEPSKPLTFKDLEEAAMAIRDPQPTDPAPNPFNGVYYNDNYAHPYTIDTSGSGRYVDPVYPSEYITLPAHELSALHAQINALTRLVGDLQLIINGIATLQKRDDIRFREIAQQVQSFDDKLESYLIATSEERYP